MFIRQFLRLRGTKRGREQGGPCGASHIEQLARRAVPQQPGDNDVRVKNQPHGALAFPRVQPGSPPGFRPRLAAARTAPLSGRRRRTTRPPGGGGSPPAASAPGLPALRGRWLPPPGLTAPARPLSVRSSALSRLGHSVTAPLGTVASGLGTRQTQTVNQRTPLWG